MEDHDGFLHAFVDSSGRSNLRNAFRIKDSSRRRATARFSRLTRAEKTRRRCRWRTPDRRLDEDTDSKSVPRFDPSQEPLETHSRIEGDSKMSIRPFTTSRPGLLALLLVLAAATVHGDTSPASASGGKVNINQASAAQIAFLPRIGIKVATRVVEHRKVQGPFARPEDLMEVKGIGEKLFLTLKPYLAVSGPTTLAAKVRSGSPRKRGGPAPANKPAQKPAPASVPAGKGR